MFTDLDELHRWIILKWPYEKSYVQASEKVYCYNSTICRFLYIYNMIKTNQQLDDKKKQYASGPDVVLHGQLGNNY